MKLFFAMHLGLVLSFAGAGAGAQDFHASFDRIKHTASRGDVETAVSLAEDLLKSKLPPAQENEARLYLAKLCIEPRREQAFEELKKLPLDVPDPRRVVEVYLGLIFELGNGPHEMAPPVCREMMRRYASHVTADDVVRAVGLLMNPRRGGYAQTEEILDDAKKRFTSPKDAERLLRTQIWLYQNWGRIAETEGLIDRLVGLYPDDPARQVEGHRLRSDMYRALGNTDKVVEAYAKIYDGNFEEAARWQALADAGACLRETKGPEAAFALLDGFGRRDPRGSLTLKALFSAPYEFAALARYEETAARLKALVEQFPDVPFSGGARSYLASLSTLSGLVMDLDGRPVAHARVVVAPRLEGGRSAQATVTADAEGRYRFPVLQPGDYLYLAATKPDDPPTCLSTFFGRREFRLAPATNESADIVFRAEPLKVLPPPPVPQLPQGRLLRSFVIREFVDRDWPRELLTYDVTLPEPCRAKELRLFDQAGKVVPHQLSGIDHDWLRRIRRCKLSFFSGLPKMGVVSYYLVRLNKPGEPAFETRLSHREPSPESLEVTTGAFSARIPWGAHTYRGGREAAAVPAPIQCVRGPDGQWRGRGRMVTDQKITAVRCGLIEGGPLFLRFRAEYEFGGPDTTYGVDLQFNNETPYVIASETIRGLTNGAFEFSVYDAFRPGEGLRGLQGSARPDVFTYRENRRLQTMPNYVMWSPDRYGYDYAVFRMTNDSSDCLATFAVHGGCWVDEEWGKYTSTPLDAAPEKPWSGNRWWGSPYSAITVEERSDPDLIYRYPFFKGKRQWGLAVYDKSLNRLPPDYAYLYAGSLRLPNAEVSLNAYKDYVLDWDDRDLTHRPHLLATNDEYVRAIVHRNDHPYLARLWKDVTEGEGNAISFAVTGNPRDAWALKNWIVFRLKDRTGIIGAGKEFNGGYSPVATRGTEIVCFLPYDTIARCGVLTPEQHRLVRAQSMFFAYQIRTPDYMAWPYHAGHPNFANDGMNIVGGAGLTFPDHPDADQLVYDAVEHMKSEMSIYTLGDGGKYAENIGSYYGWTARKSAAFLRMLVQGTKMNPFRWDKYPPFLMWAAHTITAWQPEDRTVLEKGLAPGQRYEDLPLVRRVPGVGDHGDLGNPVTDGIGLAGAMARRMGEETLGRELLATWWEGGHVTEGWAGVPLHALMFMTLAKDDLALKMTPRKSERLPGFGAVFRSGWGTTNETYLLFKCGPGGYRHHGEEAGVILYARNRPLSIDGGELQAPRHHATVTFGDANYGVGRGQVIRYSLDEKGGLDLVNGAFPADPPITAAGGDEAFSRKILFVHNSFVVIGDDMPNALLPSHWRMPLIASRIEQRDESRITAHGTLGLDLDIHVLLPDYQWTVEDDCIEGVKRKILVLTRPPGRPHLVLLHWRAPDEPPLKATPDGGNWRIEGGGVSWMLAPDLAIRPVARDAPGGEGSPAPAK